MTYNEATLLRLHPPNTILTSTMTVARDEAGRDGSQ